MWGRLIGLAFIVPLIWFWATGRIERRLRPRLALLFVLGGLQGAVGWFMVASGFEPDATAVSPYRLVVHLALALVLYAAILWTGLTVLRPVPPRPPASRSLHWLAWACCACVALTMLAGGFVAGTHAGLDYNTFPLMDGRLVPQDYARLEPFLRNLTENIAAVQFDHRLLATLTVMASIVTLVVGFATHSPRASRFALWAFAWRRSGAIRCSAWQRSCWSCRSRWRRCIRPWPRCCSPPRSCCCTPAARRRSAGGNDSDNRSGYDVDACRAESDATRR